MKRCLFLNETSKERINTNIYSMTRKQQLQVKQLYIQQCNLEEIPECVRLLWNLEVLYAAENELTSVPQWLEELPLKNMYLHGNKIKRLPLWNMPHLKILYLYVNQLEKLPCTIRDYPLHTLILDTNRFPREIQNGCVCSISGVARMIDNIDCAGCLTRPSWTKDTHKYVSVKNHIETKVSMLILNKLVNQVFPRDIKLLICSYVNTNDSIAKKDIKRIKY